MASRCMFGRTAEHTSNVMLIDEWPSRSEWIGSLTLAASSPHCEHSEEPTVTDHVPLIYFVCRADDARQADIVKHVFCLRVAGVDFVAPVAKKPSDGNGGRQ